MKISETPRLALALAALAAFAAPEPAAPAPPADALGRSFTLATPEHEWSFPRDHAAHPGYATEWWYFTGMLESAAGRRFGYQLTLFRIALSARPVELDSTFAADALVMAHAAITDVERGTHAFSEAVWRAAPEFGGFPPWTAPPAGVAGADGARVLAWCRPPLGTPAPEPDPAGFAVALRPDGAFALSFADALAGSGLSLVARPSKPLVLHGRNGFSAKTADDGSASHYYSLTRLETTGRVTAGGESFEVRGSSWMDKEFASNALGETQVGWDWFSLQLDDGRDLMLYVLREEDGAWSHASGTLVAADGRVTPLTRDEFTVEASSTFESPRGTRYPGRFRVRVPKASLDLDVEVLVRAAENASVLVPGLAYYEGPVVVRAGGAVLGHGYLELTGYGDGDRLPL